jgi:DNA-binding GntR family transcriptional regulator
MRPPCFRSEIRTYILLRIESQAISPLGPIKTSYLRDQAFERVRDAIVAGILAPGAPIVIDDLAESLGLSAMPVREAVKRLVRDGLVEELPRRAHRVAPLTRETALHVLEVMETLMVRVYELGVPGLGAGDVEAMATAIETAQSAADRGDLHDALSSIHDMHRVVYASAGNPEFARALESIGPRFDRILYLWYRESIADVGDSYRRELVDALRTDDRSAAFEIMREAWARFRKVVEARKEEQCP